MRGLLALLIIALVALSVFNVLQVAEMKHEFAQVQTKLHQRPESDISDKALAEVARAIANAKEAISRSDGKSANGYVDSAKEKLDHAGKTAGEKARATLKWLGDQTAELGHQMQEKSKSKG
jgi:hypothetical protein